MEARSPAGLEAKQIQQPFGFFSKSFSNSPATYPGSVSWTEASSEMARK